jgi:hypothetical protein
MINPTSETTLALMQQDLLYTKSGIDEIKVTLKEINARFATKQEVDARIKQIEKDAKAEIAELREKVTRLEGQNGLWRFLSPTLAAVMGSVMTFLVIQYLQNI